MGHMTHKLNMQPELLSTGVLESGNDRVSAQKNTQILYNLNSSPVIVDEHNYFANILKQKIP